MGQGSINMPAPGRSPVEGIMQALQAVHAYYGIDTQEAQQKLLASQNEEANQKTRLTKAEADKASVLAQGAKDVSEGNSTGAAAVYLGLVPKMKSQAAPASNPQTPQNPNFTPVNSTPQDSSQPFTPVSGPKTASNDNGLVDTGSPLMSILPPKQGLQSKKQAGSSGASMVQVSNPDGTVTEYGLKPDQELEYAKKQADLNKSKLESTHISQEISNKPKEQQEAYIKEFRTAAKPYKDNIQVAKELNDALLSGNKISQSLASVKNTMTQLGVKRMSGQLGQSGESPDLNAKMDKLIEKADSGRLPNEEIKEMVDSVNSWQKANEQGLTELAQDHAAQAASVYGGKPDDILKKYLLPNGSRAKYAETTIDNDHALHRMGNDGKWELIAKAPDQSFLNRMRRMAIGLGAGAQHTAGGLMHGVGNLIGGGE